MIVILSGPSTTGGLSHETTTIKIVLINTILNKIFENDILQPPNDVDTFP